jgi:hypothetical protein
MNKNIGTIAIITVLIGVMLSMVGCSSGSTAGTTTTQSTATAKTTDTKTTATTTSGKSGGALADMLGKAASISYWQCDLVQTMAATTTAPAANGTTTTHIWVSHNKMKMDTKMQGQEIIQIIDTDAKTDYLYCPAQNMATKGTMDPSSQSTIGDPNSILQYNPTVIGAETINGNLCEIIQYTSNGTTTKLWIWEAKGLGIRAEMTSAQGSYTIDYKNYDFSAIPDSTFTLPTGVKING